MKQPVLSGARGAVRGGECESCGDRRRDDEAGLKCEPLAEKQCRLSVAFGAVRSALGSFFHLARELFDPLAHDLPRFELHRGSWRNNETAARLVGIAADTRFR